jgi:hypothetical protein
VTGHVPDAVFRSVMSIPSPRPGMECSCAGCAELRHLEVERQSWRDLDDARRMAEQMRAEEQR